MQQFSSRITICRGDIEADGKNVYDILNLAVHMNDTITVKAAGQDEEKAIDTVSVFLNQKL
jgi:phosphotransferase system HPr (HPr) family protein